MLHMGWDYAVLNNSPRFIWAALVVIFFSAAFTDYRHGKIYNRLTGPVFVFSLCIVIGMSIGLFGRIPLWWLPLVSSLIAVILSLVILFALFSLRVIGGGDVKLLVAVSPLLGAVGFLEVFFWTIIIAAVGSFALMLANRRVIIFFREMIAFLKSIIVPQTKVHVPRLRADIKAPFGVALFIGFMVYSFSEGFV